MKYNKKGKWMLDLLTNIFDRVNKKNYNNLIIIIIILASSLKLYMSILNIDNLSEIAIFEHSATDVIGIVEFFWLFSFAVFLILNMMILTKLVIQIIRTIRSSIVDQEYKINFIKEPIGKPLDIVINIGDFFLSMLYLIYVIDTNNTKLIIQRWLSNFSYFDYIVFLFPFVFLLMSGIHIINIIYYQILHDE